MPTGCLAYTRSVIFILRGYCLDIAYEKKQFRIVPQILYKFDLFYRFPFEVNSVSNTLFYR